MKKLTKNSNIIEESTNFENFENKNVSDAITLIQLSEFIKLFQSHKELREKFNSLSSQKQTIEQQLKEKTNEIEKSVQLVEAKDNEIKNLEETNSNLKAEALKYQSALGAATNFQLGDDDKNNSVRLNEDIEHLQDTLEDYVTNLRSKIKINYKKVNKLFAHYNCNLEMKARIKDTTLIKALLQRHVVEFIYENAIKYFEDVKNTDEPQSLESEINFKVNELINLTDKFAKTRFESGKVTSAVPIKIRQQIYSALSNYGFSDIINDKQVKSEHKFISQFKKQLNQEIESYREISDHKKKKKCEELAAKIIREVVKLFFFRLKTQEPIAKWKWFNNNDKIDSIQMTGSWDDDDLENAVVEICIFPLIYKDPNSYSTELQIYTPAKVFIRDDNSFSSEENGENVKVVV
ncbi:4890_t:CDS:2 [Rhizophagus irregularis]|nr:4890_t:CDS:2 [Rhizophagus irregularis]